MKLRRGTNRVVLVGRHVVCKIPVFWCWRRFVHGVLANYHESEMWVAAICPGSAIEHQADYLCPVLWRGPFGLLLVMATASDTDTPWSRERILGHFEGIMSLDPTPVNVGVYCGRAVLRDYGPLILSPGHFANLMDPEHKCATSG